MNTATTEQQEAVWQQLLETGGPERMSPSLQSTLKMNLAQAMLDGRIPAGTRLPSTRSLAATLSVARVTVALTYEALTAQGFLAVRERSGHFVVEGLRDRQSLARAEPRTPVRPPAWAAHLTPSPREERWLEKPRNWQKYRYPFVYGQMDSKLFPLAEWRECSRLAQATVEGANWAADAIDRDDAFLIHQLCKRVLPRRGIEATPDQVLITMGSQMGAFLLSELLVRRGTTVAYEDPGYMDGRNIFLRRAARILPMSVDRDGAIPPRELPRLSCIYTTPSHQCPTGATLSMQRRTQFIDLAQRHRSLIIEDDYDAETQFSGTSLPALKAMDRSGYTIYLSSLSKFFAPGLRIGYIVADAELIERARQLRRLILRHTPGNNQRALALFIAHGHYDRLLTRHGDSLRARAAVIAQALAKYLPSWKFTEPVGGSALWVEAPPGTDMAAIELQARRKGVLIENGGPFFQSAGTPTNFARLAYSTIPIELIEPGIRTLAQVARRQQQSA